MGADMDSYQLKAICKQCGQSISLKTERIKSHLLKCGKGNDLGEYEEIASLVRVWDKKTESNNPKNLMPSKGKDSGHTAPVKRYGDSSDKWDKIYVGDSGKSYPNEYMDGIIDYEKYPHKRHRSESEESDESPAYKRANIGNRSVKRQRSESDSDLSDDPPLSKRYKIDVQGGKKEDGYDTDD